RGGSNDRGLAALGQQGVHFSLSTFTAGPFDQTRRVKIIKWHRSPPSGNDEFAERSPQLRQPILDLLQRQLFIPLSPKRGQQAAPVHLLGLPVNPLHHTRLREPAGSSAASRVLRGGSGSQRTRFSRSFGGRSVFHGFPPGLPHGMGLTEMVTSIA